jgi:hypothetical protein
MATLSKNDTVKLLLGFAIRVFAYLAAKYVEDHWL